jgi:CotH kinase protein/Putative metal-binding motif
MVGGRLGVVAGAALLAVGVGCGGGGPGAVPVFDGGAADSGVPLSTSGCSDLFDQDKVRTYSIEIDPAEWQKMVDEFNNVGALLTDVNWGAYHPAVLRLDGETVADAAVKLHGQSSWAQTVMFDGARAKMQFEVSFNEITDAKRFHGVSQIIFDMPRNDWTFIHDRLAHTWLRQAGIMSTCAASARLELNGSYYGVFVIEEEYSGRVVEQFYPSVPDGDLWKGGWVPKTNKRTADRTRNAAFWAATDLASVSAIVDIQASLASWAAEALLNSGDGYYGGSHNFLIYDQGAKGFAFVPQDTDATFDFLVLFDQVGARNHPVFWWEGRTMPAPVPGPHWIIVMSDAGWRKKYAEAIAALLDRWDPAQLVSWIDTWSQQIAADIAADPHTWAAAGDVKAAVAAARQVVVDRPEYLRSFVACERDGAGEDRDGDGFKWCDDCRDDDPAIYLGAPERCNGVDDNCNHTVDEGCQ